MLVKILKEAGYEEAMLGLSLSYNQQLTGMAALALRLCKKDGGHNKFLESIVVWLDITAPRYFWQQFDTYRTGVSKQSESTMHTLCNQKLTQYNFWGGIMAACILDLLNRCIENKQLELAKHFLPESFLQRRIVCTNYKTLRRMYQQRHTHKLPEWSRFCEALENGLDWPEFVK